MKVEGELFWRWLSHIAAIPTALLGRQKRNGHPFFPFPPVFSNNLYIGIDFCYDTFAEMKRSRAWDFFLLRFLISLGMHFC
jgi:hypothetical protein